jgi:pilus assembly protein CpaB
MNRRLISVLVFALVVASLTSYVLYRLILVRVQSQGQGRTVATNRLVVAKHDIQVGSFISDSDLDEVAWGAPIPEEALKTRQDIVGRGVVATVYQNEPFLQGRLAPRGAGAGLAATIPVGMRAVALRVNEVVGLAGFVVPGMRVDVLMAGNAPSAEQARFGTLCRTILQNIEVLSAGQKLDKTNDGKPESAQVVNLLVTPTQAEILNLAMSETKVQLVLRNPLDNKDQTPPGTSIAGLFGVPGHAPIPIASSTPSFRPPAAHSVAQTAPTSAQPSAPPALQREVARVEVFRGVKKSEETFDLPTGKK